MGHRFCGVSGGVGPRLYGLVSFFFSMAHSRSGDFKPMARRMLRGSFLLLLLTVVGTEGYTTEKHWVKHKDHQDADLQHVFVVLDAHTTPVSPHGASGATPGVSVRQALKCLHEAFCHLEVVAEVASGETDLEPQVHVLRPSHQSEAGEPAKTSAKTLAEGLGGC